MLLIIHHRVHCVRIKENLTIQTLFVKAHVNGSVCSIDKSHFWCGDFTSCLQSPYFTGPNRECKFCGSWATKTRIHLIFCSCQNLCQITAKFPFRLRQRSYLVLDSESSAGKVFFRRHPARQRSATPMKVQTDKFLVLTRTKLLFVFFLCVQTKSESFV